MPLSRHIRAMSASVRKVPAIYAVTLVTTSRPGSTGKRIIPISTRRSGRGWIERFPVFEALKVTGAWAGHYDHNGFETSAILGPWVGGLETFHIALGFSSHGLMQAPAAGRGLSELLFHGRHQTLDLSRLGYRRVVDSTPLHDEVPWA